MLISLSKQSCLQKLQNQMKFKSRTHSCCVEKKNSSSNNHKRWALGKHDFSTTDLNSWLLYSFVIWWFNFCSWIRLLLISRKRTIFIFKVANTLYHFFLTSSSEFLMGWWLWCMLYPNLFLKEMTLICSGKVVYEFWMYNIHVCSYALCCYKSIF